MLLRQYNRVVSNVSIVTGESSTQLALNMPTCNSERTAQNVSVCQMLCGSEVVAQDTENIMFGKAVEFQVSPLRCMLEHDLLITLRQKVAIDSGVYTSECHPFSALNENMWQQNMMF